LEGASALVLQTASEYARNAYAKGGGMRRGTSGALRVTVAVLSLVAVISGILIAPASASTKAPIIIGLITDETGPPSSSYINAEQGAQARIDAQNAAGGVDGRQLKLVAEDSTGTPNGNLTAAQLLVSEGAFGIIEDNSDAYGAAHYLSQQGIPVVGAAVDGPEWAQKQNSNMFAIADLSATTPINGYYYTYNSTGAEFKDLGITKLAQVVFNVPSAISAAATEFAAAKAVGVSDCLDALLPSDGNLNPTVLQMKNLGCNGVDVLSVLATCITMATDLNQADVKAKLICATSYDQNLLNQPSALTAMQGTYTTAALNVLNPTPPIKLYLNRLKKYTSWAGGIPSLNIDYTYFSADAMIMGLKLAGPNPTRKEFISKMRNVSDYTVGGILTTPIIFSHFGTVGMFPKKACSPILELKGKTFVPYKNVCGSLVKGAKA
jgi:branched-chain amino acid transport system substrate-binding protein